jgi:hypothetical protein
MYTQMPEHLMNQLRAFILVMTSSFREYIVTCWVYGTRHVTSRPSGSSEFIAHSLLHLHNSQFQLLPSAVSQIQLLLLPFTPANAGLQLTGYSLSSNSLLTHNWLNPHCSLNSVRSSLFRLGTDNIENTLLLGSRYQVLLSGVSTYELPSNRRCTNSPVAWRRVYRLPSNSCCTGFPVAWRHSLAGKGVYWAPHNDRSGVTWRHSRDRRVHVTPTSCWSIHVTICIQLY